MTDLSQLFMYFPGIILFLVGSGQVKNWLRRCRAGMCVDAGVISCKHVIKKDKKERELYNYYDVVVEYKNPQTGHRERLAVRSPVEYALAQQVRLYKIKDSGKLVLEEHREEFLFHPWVAMSGGALLIPLALEENRGNEIQAMLCLALLLLGAGVNLIVDYIMLKKRGLRSQTSIPVRSPERRRYGKGQNTRIIQWFVMCWTEKRISAGATSIPAAGIHFTRGSI